NQSTGNSQAQNLRSDNKNSAAKPAPRPPQLAMRVPFEPTAFPSGPHFCVMYELHLTNFGTTPLSLSRIEVLDADAGTAQQIATFDAEQLEAMFLFCSSFVCCPGSEQQGSGKTAPIN